MQTILIHKKLKKIYPNFVRGPIFLIILIKYYHYHLLLLLTLAFPVGNNIDLISESEFLFRYRNHPCLGKKGVIGYQYWNNYCFCKEHLQNISKNGTPFIKAYLVPLSMSDLMIKAWSFQHGLQI